MWKKITLTFCSTLALIAIPWPKALGLQTGKHSRANRRAQFSMKRKEKKTKLQLAKLGAKLFIMQLQGEGVIFRSNLCDKSINGPYS